MTNLNRRYPLGPAQLDDSNDKLKCLTFRAGVIYQLVHAEPHFSQERQDILSGDDFPKECGGKKLPAITESPQGPK